MQETLVLFLGWEDPPEKGKILHYSGLENSKDCIVHGASKSRTQLSDFHFLIFSHMELFRVVHQSLRQQV